MTKNREEFQTVLEAVLGSHQVYFQPPESVRMHYPAIVYSLGNLGSIFASNSVYLQKTGYEVTVIDKNPDSETAKKVALIPLCSFSRSYQSDNLNHFVFTIYY